MIKTIIFAITILTTILILGTSIVQAADHGDAPLMSNDYGAGALAIPGWVDNNFKWYGEGKISQSDLLNGIKHLMDNNLMHISDKAAEEVQNLREENRMLKQKIGVDPEDPDIILRPVPGALPELPGLPDGCPEIYAPVCGRDGRTYPNKCFADDAGVGIFHDGECRNIPHRECPNGYTWIECAGICVPHGDDYVCPDEYKWNEHAGQCTPDMDKCICTKEYNPVCGTDGKTYGNKCEASCVDAQIEYEGECRDECSSNLDCKGDLVCRDGACLVPCNIQCIQYDPVCGTDGNTYGCGIPDAQCHGVEIAHEGECRDECSSNADCSGSDVCRDEICQASCSVQCIVPDPVCGEDGITYVCGEADAACHGVEVSHEGECLALRVTPAQ